MRSRSRSCRCRRPLPRWARPRQIVAVGTQVDDDLPVLWLRVYAKPSLNAAQITSATTTPAPKPVMPTRLHRGRGRHRGAGLVRLCPQTEIGFLAGRLRSLRREAQCAAAGGQFMGRYSDGRASRPPACDKVHVGNGASRRPTKSPVECGPLPAEPGLDTRGHSAGLRGRHYQERSM